MPESMIELHTPLDCLVEGLWVGASHVDLPLGLLGRQVTYCLNKCFVFIGLTVVVGVPRIVMIRILVTSSMNIAFITRRSISND